MSRYRDTIAVGLIALTCTLAGCDTYPFLSMGVSDEEAFMAVGVSGVGGTDGLSAKAGTLASESATVSLPEDMLGDQPDEVFLAVDAAEIVVVINGDANGRANPAAKAQEHHAAITFRLARENEDACDALDEVGPFELTITDDSVTLAEESLPLDAGARSVVRNRRFEMCAETWADFDGSISVGEVSFEFGRLRGNEERVVLCHVPPGNPDNAHTITVGASAVAAHLSHGDYLGECEDDGTDDDGGDDDPGRDEGDGDGDDDDSHEDGDDADDDSNEDDDDAGDSGDEDGPDDGDEGDDGGEDDLDDEGGDDSGDDADDAGGDDNGDDDEDGDEEEGDDNGGEGNDEVPDDDDDGVADDADACPDTTSGLSVDSQGCAASQLDDDNDGVTNNADACPNTPAGQTIESNGCGCSQLDADSDGVTDCDDLCPRPKFRE